MRERSLDIFAARDISSTGVGIYLDQISTSCAVNEILEMILTLPGTRPFRARSRVRHVSQNEEGPDYFGVEFLELTPRGRAAIDDYVRSAEPAPAG